MGIYRDILESLNLVERQDGEVWKTSAGTWAGKRDGKTQYGLSDKDKAQAYVAGKDVEDEEEPSEKEPKKPSGKENPKRERGGKDKTLTDVDTSNSEFYNEEINEYEDDRDIQAAILASINETITDEDDID